MVTLANVFAVVGVLATTRVAWQIYSTLSPYLRSSKLGRYLHSPGGKKEAWALVTGASDGIGVGFAEELLHRGFHVVLHGRNANKLESVQKNLSGKYPGRQIRTLVADASVTGSEAIATVQRVVKELDSLYLTVLVNNVGAGEGERQFVKFLDRSLEEVMRVMAVNEGFPTLLTRALLPRLVERQPSLIINVGSVLGHWPCAYLEPYSGTKAHNAAFNSGLRTEMIVEGHDVEVMHLKVLSAATTSSREPLSAMTVSPRTMAKGAFDRVGGGVHTTSGCLRHEIATGLIEALIPRTQLEKGLSDAIRAKIVQPEKR